MSISTMLLHLPDEHLVKSRAFILCLPNLALEVAGVCPFQDYVQGLLLKKAVNIANNVDVLADVS